MKRPRPPSRRSRVTSPFPGLDSFQRLVLRLVADREEAGERCTVELLHQQLKGRGFSLAGARKQIGPLTERGWLKPEPAGTADTSPSGWDATTRFRLTEPGRKALSHAEATLPQSQRVAADVVRDVLDACGREGVTRSALVGQLLLEGARARLYPEIEFRGKASSREAFVARTRLTPWFVRTVLEQHCGSLEKARRHFPDLTPAQIAQADAYARRYAHEAPVESTPPDWIPRVSAGR